MAIQDESPALEPVDRSCHGISVVIPTVNEEERVGAAIRSAWDADVAEVIVADGGSTDATCSIARETGAAVIASPRGRSKQQNTGALHARGEIVLFLHADCRLARGCGRQILEAMQSNHTCVAGAFQQRIEDVGWAYRGLEWGNAWRARWLRRPYGDQGLFMRKDWFASVGGFPDVPILEEILLMRCLPKSSPLIVLPGPVFVSARRWQRAGILRQTLRNWRILTAFRFGVPLETLSQSYRPHDKKT